MDYSDEPEVVFSPITDKDYSDLYNLEMDDFVDDYPFYHARLTDQANILELGCGSGRLTRLLAPHAKTITGLDISYEMIAKANKQERDNVLYVQQDMLKIDFSIKFDTIIIPYNTINLLSSSKKIIHCLTLCKKQLQSHGSLLFQAFLPGPSLSESSGEKIFQFMMLNKSEEEKVIKETIKYFIPSEKTLYMEERYRIRPKGQRENFRDLKHSYTLYLPTLEDWHQLLGTTGFKVTTVQHGYSPCSNESINETILMFHATF